jgi:hypothetical protein
MLLRGRRETRNLIEFHPGQPSFPTTSFSGDRNSDGSDQREVAPGAPHHRESIVETVKAIDLVTVASAKHFLFFVCWKSPSTETMMMPFALL